MRRIKRIARIAGDVDFHFRRHAGETVNAQQTPAGLIVGIDQFAHIDLAIVRW